MEKTPQRPIGFGRKTDYDPNGTGDGFQWQPSEAAASQEPASEPPPRLPKAAPVYVGTGEGLAILTAYDLFALTPLSNLEQQLLQVVAGLEQRVDELEAA
ncbi:hypothetical protein [Hymenobacter yonginensis]|uniref:Peptidase S74 domain-containing protein n=1 Tax=Hymenobacter yonginensis TaxID=748197 RepID=A0ABY7PTL0_9BACT|nr:hypothetical protein [Hymenobacter yonginensis]WBO86246.1 hypothetical protein O9Z63_08285 [Hymenobacter yonginensis]